MAQQRIDWSKRLNNSKHLYVPPVVQQQSSSSQTPSKRIDYAVDMLKSDTKEMYECCGLQYTILLCGTNTFEDVLNKKGKKLLKQVREKIQANQFKDTISDYTVMNSRSGMWTANKQSEYYDPTEQIDGYLCSWNNKKITGKSNRDSRDIITSMCIFIHKSEGWCYTYSGSLYALEKAKNKNFEQFE